MTLSRRDFLRASLLGTIAGGLDLLTGCQSVPRSGEIRDPLHLPDEVKRDLHERTVQRYLNGPSLSLDLRLADGSRHRWHLYGHEPRRRVNQLEQAVTQLPPDVAKQSDHLLFLRPEEFYKDNIIADAHSSERLKPICLPVTCSIGTLYHELLHNHFHSLGTSGQRRFRDISEEKYGKRLGAPDVDGRLSSSWAKGITLPCGEYGPAFGFISPYSANNERECYSTIGQYLLLFEQSTKAGFGGGPYQLVVTDPLAHCIEDHTSRIEFMLDAGAITNDMHRIYRAPLDRLTVASRK